MKPEGRRRGKKRGRSKNKEFMDAALDAFIRDQALHKWREVDALRSDGEADLHAALASSGEFLEKGRYCAIWQACWQNWCGAEAEVDPDAPFANVEAAVREAVLEERAERQSRGDALLEDSLPYKAFIARAMEKLLAESSGEIEEWE